VFALKERRRNDEEAKADHDDHEHTDDEPEAGDLLREFHYSSLR
jgi:hypothetical protein